MKGDTFDVDGEGASTEECDSCGDEFVEATGLKSSTSECPSCSGGDLS